MFKVNNKDTRTTPMAYFTPCSSVSVVNLEQVNDGWENKCFPLISYYLQFFFYSMNAVFFSGLPEKEAR